MQKAMNANAPTNRIESGVLSFALPAEMTIENIESVAAELKQLPLGEKVNLKLDVSRIESVTTPGLQLLVALAKTLETQGGTLNFSGKTDVLTHALHDTGLKNIGDAHG